MISKKLIFRLQWLKIIFRGYVHPNFYYFNNKKVDLTVDLDEEKGDTKEVENEENQKKRQSTGSSAEDLDAPKGIVEKTSFDIQIENGDSKFSVAVENDDKVSTLKDKIYEVTKVVSKQQVLSMDEQVLQDEKTIGSLNIKESDSITLTKLEINNPEGEIDQKQEKNLVESVDNIMEKIINLEEQESKNKLQAEQIEGKWPEQMMEGLGARESKLIELTESLENEIKMKVEDYQVTKQEEEQKQPIIDSETPQGLELETEQIIDTSEQVNEMDDSLTTPNPDAMVLGESGRYAIANTWTEIEEKQNLPPKPVTQKVLLSASEKAKLKLLRDLAEYTEYESEQLEPTGEEAIIKQTFTVCRFEYIGSVVKYIVAGKDKQGEFEVSRRFNEFHALRQALVDRWPGCYIPCVPEKKISVGNKKGDFLEMRRALFERFIQEMAKYTYLIESEEFQIFVHKPEEVAKDLQSLPKQTPLAILNKYRQNFKLDEGQSREIKLAYTEKIESFNHFLKRAEADMQRGKAQMKAMADAHDKVVYSYKQTYQNLIKYEEIAVDYFSNQDVNQRFLTHPKNGDIMTTVCDSYGQVINSYREAYIWLKGEHLDMTGMHDALKGRQNVINAQQKLEAQRNKDQQELQNLEGGKTTLRNFWKSNKSKVEAKVSLGTKIDQDAEMSLDYLLLIDFLTILHGQLAIDMFKKHKVIQYKKMLYTFSLREVTNCHTTANLCHGILSGEGEARLTEIYERNDEMNDTMIAKQILNGLLDAKKDTDQDLPANTKNELTQPSNWSPPTEISHVPSESIEKQDVVKEEKKQQIHAENSDNDKSEEGVALDM